MLYHFKLTTALKNIRKIPTLRMRSCVTPGQDGDIGRHASPPHTTIRRITTNLKAKYSQNCQKIELHGSPTIKDLKKKYSSRQVGGERQGAMAEITWCGSGSEAAVAGGTGGPMFTQGR